MKLSFVKNELPRAQFRNNGYISPKLSYLHYSHIFCHNYEARIAAADIL